MTGIAGVRAWRVEALTVAADQLGQAADELDDADRELRRLAGAGLAAQWSGAAADAAGLRVDSGAAALRRLADQARAARVVLDRAAGALGDAQGSSVGRWARLPPAA